MRRALVLGLARSGLAAALALRAAGTEVVGVDRNLDLDAGRLRAAGVEVHVGREDAMLLDEGIDVLVKSPGVPATAPLVTRARALGIPVWSEIELGGRMLAQPILGVTGTNGKTTTSELLGAIFTAAGQPVEVAGNIGRPLTSLVGATSENAWIVCELSSFQLEDIDTFRPDVAVLLNLEADHIDRHGSFDSYAASKLRIFENQISVDVAVVPRGFGVVPGRGRRIEFSVDDPLPAEPRIPGVHNRENAAAATVAARAVGIPDDAIRDALQAFPGVAHRIETVATVRGVRYVNDSKATNVAAARRAVAAIDSPIQIVLGGLGKDESYTPLATDLPAGTKAYLIGTAAPAIAEALKAAGIRFEPCEDLENAVRAAAASARPGETVLLSPACASFDQFTSFEERGDTFRRIVEALAREANE
jgi:UDP-N-acetylmuramoylalanine--D-glutamate ligase